MQQQELKAIGGFREAGEPELDMDEEDPEQWDAFKDAHKFEILNRQQEKARMSMVQAEFNQIKKADEEEKQRIEEISRSADLEASVHEVTERLEIKERQLAEKQMVEEKLQQMCETLMIQIENKDREMIRLNNMLDEAEAVQIKFEVLSEEQLVLINKLQ